MVAQNMNLSFKYLLKSPAWTYCWSPHPLEDTMAQNTVVGGRPSLNAHHFKLVVAVHVHSLP